MKKNKGQDRESKEVKSSSPDSDDPRFKRGYWVQNSQYTKEKPNGNNYGKTVFDITPGKILVGICPYQ
ncbi:MAG: hypothetical protein AB2L24_00530 [Mangrovibacterium sp.]